MLNSLLDYTSSIEATPPDNLTIILICVAILFFCVACIFLVLYINEKSNEKANKQLNEVSPEEQDLLKQYKNLNNDNKKLINKMLSSLNDNKSDKE